MAVSDLQICNLALREVSLETISALDELSPEAEDCNDFYPQCRDIILEQHPWNFAQKRAELAAVAVPAGWSHYAYAYVYPNDCVNAHALYVPGSTVKQDFEVAEADDGSQIILCDVTPAVLAYTKRVTDTTRYTALFTECLYLLLASKLAWSRLKDTSLEQAKLTKANNALGEAQRRDSKEGNPDEVDETPWVLARLKENNWG
jgi:hypothetical protein